MRLVHSKYGVRGRDREGMRLLPNSPPHKLGLITMTTATIKEEEGATGYLKESREGRTRHSVRDSHKNNGGQHPAPLSVVASAVAAFQ